LVLLRQKGLFIFSILILGFLAFRYWAVNQNPPFPEKMVAPGITIELTGKVFRPGLLHYQRSPTIEQVVRDGGGVLPDQVISTNDEKVGLLQDATLIVGSGKNGNIFIQQNPLSAKALWILGRPIPLNQATAEDLDRLPGIGSTLALRIVEYRQGIGNFSSLDQLLEVNGLKEKTLEKIKRYLTL
jgi:competence protein ComEA